MLNDKMILGRREFMVASAGALSAAGSQALARQFALRPSEWSKLPAEHYHGKQDDIFFIDPHAGWYGNGSGCIFGTTDGGLTWQKLFEKPGTFVRAIGFLDRQTGFFGNIGTDYFPGVTDTNPLYRTADGGLTWAPVEPISGPWPRGICAIDIQRTPFINAGHLGERVTIRAGGRVGSPAYLLESRDRGTTWTSRDMNSLTAMILDIKFVTSKVGFIAGATNPDVERSSALILRTLDGGATWHRVYDSRRPWEVSWKLSFPSPRVGYATVQNYDPNKANVRRVVAKTSDGGATWHELRLVDDHAVNELGVGFLNEHRGWVGTTTTGFETQDGGKSWSPVEMGAAVNKVRIVRSRTECVAYAIGKDIYKLKIS